MKKVAFLCLLLTGCSTAPLADFLDFFHPGRLKPGSVAPYGGVCSPVQAGVPVGAATTPVAVPGPVPPAVPPPAVPAPPPGPGAVPQF